MHEMTDLSATETTLRRQKIQAPTLIPWVTEVSHQHTRSQILSSAGASALQQDHGTND